MLAHDRPFGRLEGAALGQQGLRDADLAEIVQHPGTADPLDELVRDMNSATGEAKVAAIALGPVGIQDSHSSLSMIQAFDGTIRIDRRSMGEDGAAVSG